MKSALKQDKGSFQRFVYLGQNSSSVTDPRCNFNLQGYFYQVYIHCICNAVCVTVFKVLTRWRLETGKIYFFPFFLKRKLAVNKGSSMKKKNKKSSDEIMS